MHRCLVLGLLLGTVGCDSTYTARLDHGAGLGEGSRVMVSGVHVGEVRSVRVVEGHVDVELAIFDDHDITLREDACAMAGRDESGPFLIVQPGEGAMRGDDERPIPQCEIETAQVGDMLRTLSEGMGSLLEELGRGLLQPPSAPPAPAQAPPPVVDEPSPCGRVVFTAERIETVRPVPVHFPDGGHRVIFEVRNDNSFAMRVGSLNDATFLDGSRRALPGTHLLSDDDGWFMPFEVPANASRRVSVAFARAEGAAPPAIESIEVTACSPVDRVFETCTIRQEGLGGAPP